MYIIHRFMLIYSPFLLLLVWQVSIVVVCMHLRITVMLWPQNYVPPDYT